MTAFTDYYLSDVQVFLQKIVSDLELRIAKTKYIRGWHPRRTALFLKGDYPTYKEIVNSLEDQIRKLEIDAVFSSIDYIMMPECCYDIFYAETIGLRYECAWWNIPIVDSYSKIPDGSRVFNFDGRALKCQDPS